MMKKILVYPCGTELGLEIFRAVRCSSHYELYGGSSTYDHGRFVYKNHIDNLPFITDNSSVDEILRFDAAIRPYKFDCIYPTMDGVITVFSKYREALTPVVVAPSYETTRITRSKRATYELFKNIIPIPTIYRDAEEIKNYPVFIKPAVGQGSVGTLKIESPTQLQSMNAFDDGLLVLEYLPGREYTVDCFTNSEGRLIYCKGRTRNRIKSGISVNATFCDHPKFHEYANLINDKLNQVGAWFFQLKEAADGELKLMEIASRAAGTSTIARGIGVNLPLLTLDSFNGLVIDDVCINNYPIELDRAMYNVFKICLPYRTVYIDYDDTIIVHGRLNLTAVKFLFQCIDNGKRLVLITRHAGVNLDEELQSHRLDGLFDEIIHLDAERKKSDVISDSAGIFIDDSYGERKDVATRCGIPVFDVNMIECLLED